MEVRTAASPRDVKHYTTDRLREEFLIQDLFQADKINLVYSHIDRIITGAAVPVNEKTGSDSRGMSFVQSTSFREENLESSISVEMESSQSMDVFMK